MATRPLAAPARLRIPVLARLSESTLALGVGALLMLAALRLLPPYPQLAPFSAGAIARLPDVLAPLVVIALFLERATEVVMTAWRSERTKELEVALAREIARQGGGDARANPWAAKARLAAYRAQSQRLAFLTAGVLALVVSLMGVRAVEMIVEPGAVAGFTHRGQQTLFVGMDILITGLLLAGGADGIHKVVDAFTTFLDSTRQRVKVAGLPLGAPDPGASPAEDGPARG